VFIIQFFRTYLKPLFIFIISFIGVYLVKRNKYLSEKVMSADKHVNETKKVIDVQNKIISVTKNTKRTNIAGNIERMRKNKL